MITNNDALQKIKLTGQYEIASRPTTNKPTEVIKTNSCPDCGKPDWCYSVGKFTICNSQKLNIVKGGIA